MSSLRRHDARACNDAEVIEVADIGEQIGPCPSGCGAILSIGLAPRPSNPRKSERVLMHPIPFCTYYGKVDPDAIIAEVVARAEAAGVDLVLA